MDEKRASLCSIAHHTKMQAEKRTKGAKETMAQKPQRTQNKPDASTQEQPKFVKETQEDELKRYRKILGSDQSGASQGKEGLRNVPLLSWPVKKKLGHSGAGLRQYAVLGHDPTITPSESSIPVLLNTMSPWSVFLCGSQGSGKSYTLSCILENCILAEATGHNVGKNPNPLAGLVFHYDRSQGGGVCEAAYLCSDVDVRVLVSRSNYKKLKQKYEALAIPKGRKKIEVQALDLRSSHLNTERMKALMAIGKTGEMPLYMNVSYCFKP